MTATRLTINSDKEEIEVAAAAARDAEIVPINLNASSFDYQSLDAVVATEMRSAACRTRQRTRLRASMSGGI